VKDLEASGFSQEAISDTAQVVGYYPFHIFTIVVIYKPHHPSLQN